MIRRLAFGALLLALSGCPESPSKPLLPPVVAATLENQAEAGTRLRPRFVRGEQVRLFLGWRDTARNSSVNTLRGRRCFDSWSMWDTVSAFRSVSEEPDQAHSWSTPTSGGARWSGP